MRISMINLNLVGTDAIGQCILQQARFCVRRGDQVGIYTLHPPQSVPADMAALTHVVTAEDLIAQRDSHFAQSDLYVYHYPSRHALMESMVTLERGAVLFYFHNVTPPSLLDNDFEREVLEYSLASVGSLTAYADVIVTDSSFNADQLVLDHGVDRTRIRVLPLAVPLNRFSPGPKDPALLNQYNLHGKRVIIFVGRMADNKRVDLLIEALPSIRQRVPNAVLLLVGDAGSNPAIADTVARAKARAEALGVAAYVIFTGVVDDQAPYYRLSDVYASASLHEGFGVPLIEAMASGVPIVASKATAHPWVVGDAGLLAEPNNAVSLAAQVIRVLNDDQLHGDLVQRGLLRVKEFSLEQHEAGWRQIIAEATVWLPQQPFPRMRSTSTASPLRAAALAQSQADRIKWLSTAADVMQHGYTVRSGAPVVGPLIAWVRRNLTSHLREPYLDPTLERQVAFNREVVQLLQRLLARTEGASSAEVSQQIHQLEAQIAELQQQVDALTRSLTDRKA